MRILIINWRDIRDPEAGGAEVHLQETFSRIVASGHQVTLLCSRYPGASENDCLDGIEIIRFGGKWTFNLAVPWFYRRHLAHRSFDVVIEDINKIPFLLPWFVKDIPVMVLLHHLFGTTFYRQINPLPATYLYLMERLIPWVYRRCPFEVVSASCRDELVGMGVPAGRISVVHNGLDAAIIDAPATPEGKEAGLIVYLGRLKKYKNVDHLIQAMAIVRDEVPGARLVVAGTGDRRPALEALTRALDLEEAVEFAGYVSEPEKISLLTRAEVAANPSSKEGWGISVIEANARGTPVVATRVAGLRDAVVDGETGLLTPLGDRKAMARALIGLLREPEERERLARNARERSRRYTWDDTARQTIRVIRHAMGESADAR